MITMKSILTDYINHTITTPTDAINGYVPNSHIGVLFSEVYEFIEYYESGEHVALFEKYDFESIVAEVFPEVEITDDSVHVAYQKLREKRNDLV